ncbi:MAG: hypothetical protein AAGC55_25865 [Myxococcota bacterium]
MDSTECEPAPRAHCFQMTSAMLQSLRWRCFGSHEDCSYERTEFKKRLPEEVEFGDCGLSAETLHNRAPKA